MSKEMNAILDKLQKLKTHEESARSIGSIEEANAFAEKINELLLRHKISMGEVEMKTQEQTDKISEEWFDSSQFGIKKRQTRVAWMEGLAHVVAEAHFCRILVTKGNSNVWFVGRGCDRTVVTQLYGYLLREIEYHANREYDKAYHRNFYINNQAPTNMKGWKASFIKGTIIEIRRRFQETRKKVEEDPQGGCVALILVADKDVDNYIADKFKKKSKAINGNRGFNNDGYQQGRVYGSQVDLTLNNQKLMNN